jgi:hypothetical protein
MKPILPALSRRCRSESGSSRGGDGGRLVSPDIRYLSARPSIKKSRGAMDSHLATRYSLEPLVAPLQSPSLELQVGDEALHLRNRVRSSFGPVATKNSESGEKSRVSEIHVDMLTLVRSILWDARYKSCLRKR